MRKSRIAKIESLDFSMREISAPSTSRRAVKPARTPTFLAVPRDIVILGIDPGDIPGYGLLDHGIYIRSGVAKEAYRKEFIIAKAIEQSAVKRKPLIVAAENWPSPFLPDRKRMSHKSILGMGMNWGKWLQELEKVFKDINTIIRLNTLDWRKFYGIHRCNKDQAKRMALPIASKLAGKTITDHNEAEAILIANVGCYLEV